MKEVFSPYLHLTTTWMFLPFSSRFTPLRLCEAMMAESCPPLLWCSENNVSVSSKTDFISAHRHKEQSVRAVRATCPTRVVQLACSVSQRQPKMSWRHSKVTYRMSVYTSSSSMNNPLIVSSTNINYKLNASCLVPPPTTVSTGSLSLAL